MGVYCNQNQDKYCKKSPYFDCGNMIAEEFCRDMFGNCIALTANSCRDKIDFSCVST